jgi:hypothetical protein
MNGNDETHHPLSPISAPITDRGGRHEDIIGAIDLTDRVFSYRHAFIHDFESAQRRITSCTTALVDVIKMSELRVQQEKASLKLVSRPSLDAKDHISNAPSVASRIDAFSLTIQKKIHLSKQYVSDVEGEVLKPLLEYSNVCGAQVARLLRDGMSLSESIRSEQLRHDEALKRFEATERTTNGILETYKSSMSPDVRISVGLRCFASIQLEREYHEAVFRVNQSRREYLEAMGRVLDELQEIETSCLSQIKDAIDKLFIYEFALCRGTQYDLENCFKGIDESLESQSSIQPAKAKWSGPAKIVSAQDLVGVPIVVSPKASSSEEVQSVERNIIEKIWNGNVEISQDELEAIQEVFSTQSGRLSFCKAIHTQSPQLPSLTCLSNLGKVLNSLLSISEADMDTECARRVAAFALKFFDQDVSGKKKFIQAEVYHHSLWNRIQFWEEACVSCIADFFINQYLERLDGAVQRYSFTFPISLDRFGTFLMVFGISYQSAREIVNRVVEREIFDSLDDATRAGVHKALFDGVVAAHERQERNLASLKTQ